MIFVFGNGHHFALKMTENDANYQKQESPMSSDRVTITHTGENSTTKVALKNSDDFLAYAMAFVHGQAQYRLLFWRITVRGLDESSLVRCIATCTTSGA